MPKIDMMMPKEREIKIKRPLRLKGGEYGDGKMEARV